MGKVRVTEKELRNSYGQRLVLPYGECQTLLNMLAPAYYTAGVYGWNQDCYIIDENMLLCIGYRTIGKIPISPELRAEYEGKAKHARALYPYSLTWSELRSYCENWIYEMCIRAIKEYNESKKK